MVRVSTIPAGVPFVDALASGLLAEADGDALALADMLVLLPNRRACRSLRDAFWRAGQGRALALPAIQPIGDLDPDELLIDAESELELPPAIGALRRRLLLTRLLKPLGWRTDQAGRLADDLASLLDELQTERVPFDELEALVPAMFAEHWQKSLQILQIVGRHWPGVLAGERALDPAERRHRVLTALAERWVAAPPAQRIVAAGSTGSVPATRELLKVIASLPAGEVVLPGLDQALDDAGFEALTPEHPQFGMKDFLNALGLPRAAVETWEGGEALDRQFDDKRHAREGLLRAVMQPLGAGGWRDLPPIDPLATDGIFLSEHPDPAIEALSITLRLRAALLEEGRTAALITPDRALARRVVVELRRFGIAIDDSAGVPLDQTVAGSFLLLAARLVVEGVRPVSLLSLLKHPLMRANLETDEVRRRARLLERSCLRGPALIDGFRPIIGLIDDRRRRLGEDRLEEREQFAGLRDWLESLSAAASSFTALAAEAEVPFGALLEAHLGLVEALAAVDGSAEALWAKEAGEAAALLFRELMEAQDPEDRIPPAAYPALLGQLMAARPVRPRRPGHPRLFIWGQLEARLQQADLTILAGLNEGVWPRREEPDAWLNPSMRGDLGLPPLERRVGQAAHDFVQAAAGGEVVLSRSEKDLDGNRTVPSRWLVRLKAFLEGRQVGEELEPTAGKSIADDPSWQAWAIDLDLPGGVPSPEPQPTPRPPVHARPRKLSVSDIGLWMTNPYGLYARRILRLKRLDPLEADPGAGDRGTIIHKALERFIHAFPSELPVDALSELRACGQDAFKPFSQCPQVLALWWPRFLRVAEWTVGQEGAVRPGIREILAEVEGDLVIEVPAGPFQLTARADRLELHADGSVVIVDYKTGQPPSKKDMELGIAPQLALEGAILQGGGFAGMGSERRPLADLQFWQLSGNEKGGKVEARSTELVEEALKGLDALIRHYDQAGTAYPAAYRPPTARSGDYDHLARLGEWPN